jgi:hypothetical protein
MSYKVFIHGNMSQNRNDMLCDLVAIDLGIIHPSISRSDVSGGIDEALESLGPDGAQKAKRKFRKLYRKYISKHGSFATHHSRSMIRELTHWELKSIVHARFPLEYEFQYFEDNYTR